MLSPRTTAGVVFVITLPPKREARLVPWCAPNPHSGLQARKPHEGLSDEGWIEDRNATASEADATRPEPRDLSLPPLPKHGCFNPACFSSTVQPEWLVLPGPGMTPSSPGT